MLIHNAVAFSQRLARFDCDVGKRDRAAVVENAAAGAIGVLSRGVSADTAGAVVCSFAVLNHKILKDSGNVRGRDMEDTIANASSIKTVRVDDSCVWS